MSSPIRRAPRGLSVVPFVGDLLALARLARDGEARAGLRFLAVATLVYVVSPIDALPEAFLPVVAWVDDVGLVLALRALLQPHLERYRYPLFAERPRATHTSFEERGPTARVA